MNGSFLKSICEMLLKLQDILRIASKHGNGVVVPGYCMMPEKQMTLFSEGYKEARNGSIIPVSERGWQKKRWAGSVYWYLMPLPVTMVVSLMVENRKPSFIFA